MSAAPSRDWSVFKQIFADHWEPFQHAHPRYQTSYCDGLVTKMLACGTPEKMGYLEYRCLHCGQGKHLVAMRCKSSLCLRCAKVYVDNWVSQVSQVLHEGVIYRHIILTVPAMFRTTFYQNAAVLLSALMRCGAQCLDRHVKGNWGDVPEQDKQENELSVEQGLRILSAYTTSAGDKIWILTEADRSATTILLPEEY